MLQSCSYCARTVMAISTATATKSFSSSSILLLLYSLCYLSGRLTLQLAKHDAEHWNSVPRLPKSGSECVHPLLSVSIPCTAPPIPFLLTTKSCTGFFLPWIHGFQDIPAEESPNNMTSWQELKLRLHRNGKGRSL
ncbi:hypothetical protein GUJ93_ZPchr0001g29228 [Zizania palustris]|uniref:Uncharacterized protein n=1 Tax=Zizania palustris TaxID=103762 RepID=A0A8J5S9Y0_ZIZPA|nr:hypothetical protein GUJ93_ZPchr0001g29228 [Zizania palustris]